MHWMDRALGRLASRTRLFPDGWGEPRVLQGLTKASLPASPDLPVVHWTGEASVKTGKVFDGWFESPAAVGPLPPAAHKAFFQLSLPRGENERPPLVLLLPALGDLDLGWRAAMISSLAAEGIGSLVLEQAFVGRRRGSGDKGALPRSVAEFLLQARSTVVESCALLEWALARGHGKAAVAGIGVGATLAATVGAACTVELGIVPLGPAEGLGPLLLDGVLARGIDFQGLGGTAPDAAVSARHRLMALAEGTSLLSAAPPPKIRRAIFLAARQDGLVPPGATLKLLRHWTGAELRSLAGGHVSSALTGRGAHVKALLEALSRIPATPAAEV